MPFRRRSSPGADAAAAGHGSRIPVRPRQRAPFPARPAWAVHAAGRAGASQAASGREARDLPAGMRMAGSAGANAMQGMQELFRTPLQRVFRRPDRRFAMREGCSAPERTDAFLDSMPLSAGSAQSRPSMAEGFLAVVRRTGEGWGPEATSGRSATPVWPGPARQDAPPSPTGACAADAPDTFAAVVSAACTRPLPASTPMRALLSEMPVPALPGLVRLGAARGPCPSWSPAPRWRRRPRWGRPAS